MDFLTDFFLLQDDKKDKTIWRNSCFVQILSTILNHFRFDKALAKTIDIILLFLGRKLQLAALATSLLTIKFRECFLKQENYINDAFLLKKKCL
jgi:hypothetical protein